MSPLQVRFAKEPNKIMPSTEPNDQNKLFFARAPTAATEKDLKDTFSEFGEVCLLHSRQPPRPGLTILRWCFDQHPGRSSKSSSHHTEQWTVLVI